MRPGKSPLTVLPVLWVVLAAGPAFCPVDAHQTHYEINIDKPTPDWREGPVRYIITKEEDKAYKTLKTEQERATFIDIFWRRRDPSPKTEYNEFKEKFRNRCLDAGRLYSETTTPGWKTDMGKVYILVGPPDEMVRDRVPRAGRGTVIWIYRQPPFPDLAPNTVIAFAKNVQGEYMLSSRPTFDSDVAHGLQFMGPRATDPDSNLPIYQGTDPLMLAQGVPFAQDEFQTSFIYARVQQLPPKEAAILHDVVVTRSSFDVIPFRSRYSFFKTSSAATLVAVTLAIKTTSVLYRSEGGKERPDLGMFGKLVDQDHPGNEIALSSAGGFEPAPANETAGIDDYLLYQATVPVKPGRYVGIFGAEDRVARKVGTFREPLVVPDLSTSQALSLSSITLAQSIATIPPPESESKPSPFVFGSLQVVQALEARLRPTASLNFYYQVYNVQKDPATGQPSLDIDYDFFATQPGGDVSLGNIHIGPTASQVQAYSLPLERFHPSDYKLRVTVTDKVAGIKTTEEIPFTVIP